MKNVAYQSGVEGRCREERSQLLEESGFIWPRTVPVIVKTRAVCCSFPKFAPFEAGSFVWPHQGSDQPYRLGGSVRIGIGHGEGHSQSVGRWPIAWGTEVYKLYVLFQGLHYRIR